MNRYNATIQQNASWVLNVTITDSGGTAKNLTGYTGKSQIKSAYGASAVLAEPTVTITDAANGKLEIKLTAAQTAALAVTVPGKLPVWDVLISNTENTLTFRILEGNVTVTPGVTVWS